MGVERAEFEDVWEQALLSDVLRKLSYSFTLFYNQAEKIYDDDRISIDTRDKEIKALVRKLMANLGTAGALLEETAKRNSVFDV